MTFTEQPAACCIQDDLLAGSGPTLERRQDHRHLTVLRVAKLTSGTTEGLGIVRNVSKSGMMLEVDPSFSLERSVSIHLGDEHQFHGELRWRETSTCGIAFDTDVNVETVLAKPARNRAGNVVRMQRIDVHCPAKLRIAGSNVDATLMDISLGGARLELAAPAQIDDIVGFDVAGLCNHRATVRWAGNDQIGIAFHRALNVRQLMAWLAQVIAANREEAENTH